MGRVRQPVRCRPDRLYRVFVRICRDAGLRRAADARHRFPVQAILSDATPRSRRWISGPRTSAGARLELGLVGDVGATIAALLPKLAAKADRAHLDAALAHYERRAKGWTRWPGNARPQADPSAIPRPGGERRRRRRCGLHLRRRHPDDLGCALSPHERKAAHGRLARARVDGERDAASDRHPGRAARTASHFAFRRRRLHHADGRPDHA